MEEKIYDMVIIGAGPAGMSAAVYAKRAEFSVLVIERDFASGGQIVKTYEVDNYLGLPGIGGYELGEKFREHVDKFEVPFVRDKVQEIQLDGKLKKVITRKVIHKVIHKNAQDCANRLKLWSFQKFEFSTGSKREICLEM